MPVSGSGQVSTNMLLRYLLLQRAFQQNLLIFCVPLFIRQISLGGVIVLRGFVSADCFYKWSLMP